jgi:hypothetical protein
VLTKRKVTAQIVPIYLPNGYLPAASLAPQVVAEREADCRDPSVEGTRAKPRSVQAGTFAIEEIRRMRGGAQSHLMRCESKDADEEAYYVVKFKNNPQGIRILTNELLGAKLAIQLGLPVPPPIVVEVKAILIENTADLRMQSVHSRTRCKSGLQFGSKYPSSPTSVVVYDFLSDYQLSEVTNLCDFNGMLVFDQWTCNTDGRQAIFFRPDGKTCYHAQMIDQGFCFNGIHWDFPDGALRGIYSNRKVYESVRGMKSFEPWLGRLESRVTETIIEHIEDQIPIDWYESDHSALHKLLEQLLRRRKLVPDLLISAWKSSPAPFPNWK